MAALMVWMTAWRKPRSTRLGCKEEDMNLKNLIKTVVVKEATNKILPMGTDVSKPKIGWKTKLAGILATIAAIAAAGAEVLGG
jgi:hypothetical protein